MLRLGDTGVLAGIKRRACRAGTLYKDGPALCPHWGRGFSRATWPQPGWGPLPGSTSEPPSAGAVHARGPQIRCLVFGGRRPNTECHERPSPPLSSLRPARSAAGRRQRGRLAGRTGGGGAGSHQHRQDLPGHGTHAGARQRHDGLPAAPAGAGKLRQGGQGQGGGPGGPGDGGGKDHPPRRPLLDLHRRIHAAGPCGAVPGGG
ncbi:translation initiation factor IF-2 [Nitrospirillum viridazoti Y2]|nr:translation initiation factor IF-2 [Nitrospirillum amazonense Y2]